MGRESLRLAADHDIGAYAGRLMTVYGDVLAAAAGGRRRRGTAAG
jgi:hypothetical protein